MVFSTVEMSCLNIRIKANLTAGLAEQEIEFADVVDNLQKRIK